MSTLILIVLRSGALLFVDDNAIFLVVSFVPDPFSFLDLAGFILTIDVNDSQNTFFPAIFELSLCEDVIVIKPSNAVSFTIYNLSGVDKIRSADCHNLIFNPVGVSLFLVKAEILILIIHIHLLLDINFLK